MTENQFLASLQAEAKKWRQTLHQHPQTSYEEEFASEFIQKKLSAFGLEYDSGWAKTGVVGKLAGRGVSDKKIALRADIDALDILEENEFDYRSKFPGKMHACGHDGHTAMLLAAAKYLAKERNFSGEVYFIFQPAEEGGGGAKRMIDEGLFDKYQVDSVWGLHNNPGMALSEIGVKAGALMASADDFRITIRGRGGHAALPHLAIDPILIGAQIVNSLQSIVARNLAATSAGVITVSCFQSGQAFNVIPDEAKLIGTFRALDGKVRDLLMNRIKAVCQNTAAAFGAEVSFSLADIAIPVLVNSELETEIAAKAALKTVKKVHRDIDPTLGGEDFSFMLHHRPGSYVLLGNGDFGAKGGEYLHSPRYDFNDDAAIYGINYWKNLVETVLPL